jgi:hypothetical protein
MMRKIPFEQVQPEEYHPENLILIKKVIWGEESPGTITS